MILTGAKNTANALKNDIVRWLRESGSTWIRRGVYLLIFLLPWQTRWIWHEGSLAGGQWEYGTFSLYGTDLLLVFLAVLAAYVFDRRKAFRMAPRFWIVAGAFLAVTLLSYFVARDAGVALYASWKVFEGLLLVWVLLTVGISLRGVAVSLGAAAVVQSVIAVVQFALQSVPASKWFGLAAQVPSTGGVYVIETVTERFLRAYGSLHPILLATLLSVALVLLVTHLVSSNRRTLLTTIGLPIVTLGLFLTFSRVGWVAIVLGMGALLLLGHSLLPKTRAIRRLWLAVVGVGVSAATLVLLYSPIIQTRISAETRLEHLSLNERTLYLNDAAEIIANYWYQGVGAGNVTLAVAQTLDTNREAFAYQPPNNVFIILFAELGVVGFGVFVWMLWEAFRQGMNRAAALSGRTAFLAYGGVIAIVLLLFQGLFDHTLWTHHVGILLFWLLLGGLLTTKKATQSDF